VRGGTLGSGATHGILWGGCTPSSHRGLLTSTVLCAPIPPSRRAPAAEPLQQGVFSTSCVVAAQRALSHPRFSFVGLVGPIHAHTSNHTLGRLGPGCFLLGKFPDGFFGQGVLTVPSRVGLLLHQCASMA
jgi:hypothetical protein